MTDFINEWKCENDDPCEVSRQELNKTLAEAAEKPCRSGRCRTMRSVDQMKRRDAFAMNAPPMPDWWLGMTCKISVPKEELSNAVRFELEVQWRWEFADAMIAGDGESLKGIGKKKLCDYCGGSGTIETELYEGLTNCPACNFEGTGKPEQCQS